MSRTPPRKAFEAEAPTKPSVSNPLARDTGALPKSQRDPSELVSGSELPPPRSSHQRPALRRPIPREDFAPDEDPAATPRPVGGGIALEAVPHVVAPAARLTSLPLDHKAGFILASIDGESTVQTLIDVSGLPPHDVVGTLRRLLELGIIVVR